MNEEERLEQALSAEKAADLLAETALFGGLARSSALLLAGQAQVHRLPDHSTIFREDEPGDALYVIVAGVVKLEVKRPGGERFLLTTLGRPEAFGELSLLHGSGRSATAVTLSPTTLLGIDRATFIALVAREPTVLHAVVGSFGSLIRRLTAQSADLALLDLKGRVARVLVALADKQVSPAGVAPAPEVEIRLTQVELAQMSGGSRQSVNQVLAAFQSRGLIELRNRAVLIKRLELLRIRAGG